MINLIKNVSRNFKQSIKFFWQRKAKGFDDSEMWNLDQSLARLILPRLKRFKEINKSLSETGQSKDLMESVDEMIFAFEWIDNAKHFGSSLVVDDMSHKRVENGLKLFSKHYTSLWI